MKLEHSVTPIQKINSNWFKDLNVKPGTIKLLEGKLEQNLFEINYSNNFLDPSHRVMKIKTKITNGT